MKQHIAQKEPMTDADDYTFHHRKYCVFCCSEHEYLYGPGDDADREVREWHRSPITRLSIADQSFLAYLQIVLAAVSIITSVLFLFGVRNRMIRTIQLVSVIGSTFVFIIIMIATSDSHAKYA